MRLHTSHHASARLFRARLSTHSPLAQKALDVLRQSREQGTPRVDARATAEAMLDDARLARMLASLDQGN